MCKIVAAFIACNLIAGDLLGEEPNADGPADAIEASLRVFRQHVIDGEVPQAIDYVRSHRELIGYQHPLGTPLVLASFAGRTKVVEALLDLGADPNERADWQTPLLMPIMMCGDSIANPPWSKSVSDHAATFDLLLCRGADPAKCSFVGGHTGLYVGQNELSSETSLLKRADRYQTIGVGNTRLRSRLIARLREHLDLPVDAMNPLNSHSLHWIDRPDPTPDLFTSNSRPTNGDNRIVPSYRLHWPVWRRRKAKD